MKKLVTLCAFLIALAVPARAQDDHGPDHWPATEEGLSQCLDRENIVGRYYAPSSWLVNGAKLKKLAPNEEVKGHPGGCELVELPDRLTGGKGVGWIRVAEGQAWLYDKKTGEPLGDPRCKNRRFRGVLFPHTEGKPGLNGVNCWDLDGDGYADPEEDLNDDGQWTALDCQGMPGVNCWDIDGDGVNDPEEDTNNDGVLDTRDCQGKPGIDCWDLDGDGTNDPGEDFNGDGLWNGTDCVCRVWKTRSLFRKFKWEQCPGQPRIRTEARFRPWVKGTLIVTSIGTGGYLAPLYCYTVASGAAVGAVVGTTAASAADTVADIDDSATETTTSTEEGASAQRRKQ